jgi:hypothetical protein
MLPLPFAFALANELTNSPMQSAIGLFVRRALGVPVDAEARVKTAAKYRRKGNGQGLLPWESNPMPLGVALASGIFATHFGGSYNRAFSQSG